MQFHQGYSAMNDSVNAMDRDFYGSAQRDDMSSIQGQSESDPNWSVKEIGMSVPMGIAASNAAGIAAKIRMGVNSIEIGFPTMGSGGRGGQTPEMYGKDQRQAIKELGMANDVKFTTHAAYNVMGLTGMQQQGSDMYKFDMNMARMGQQEIERAVDFAADVPGGGSVVVHTGEYIRPLTDIFIPGMERNLSRGSDGRLMFKQRLTEDKDAKFYLIDDRDGRAVPIEKDKLVPFPVWNRYESSNSKYWNRKGGARYVDEAGQSVMPGDYINYRGNKIVDPFDPQAGRVPVFNEEQRRLELHYMKYDDFKKEAEEKNRYRLERFRKIGKPLTSYDVTTQNEAFIQASQETQEGTARGWAGYYGQHIPDNIKSLEKLYEAKRFYERLDRSMPESEKWKMLKRMPGIMNSYAGEFVPSESKSPLQLIDESIKSTEQQIQFEQQTSAAQATQAYEINQSKTHLVDPIKYVDRFTTRGYAEAGIHAMERSKDPKNPVVLTLEHIFPERFGGHPEEHMWIVKRAREHMVEMLTKKEIELGSSFADKPVYTVDPKTGVMELTKQPNPFFKPGISRDKAKELAEQHIKITIDTGHLNLWRKYFQPKPGATPEQNESEFRGWYLNQVEKMAKEKMIGNVHLVDNYGYQDEHLAPGQGNTPVTEVMQILKKYGYDKAYTVEPGADASTDLSDFHGLMKAWRHFGSPIYGMGSGGGGGGMAGGGRGQTWGEVQYSYFGQNQPPYFVFGAYAPSNDWTLWSQTPME